MTIIQFITLKKSRKHLAALIATYLRVEAEYLGAPSFAYQIGKARLSRDWQLYLPDGGDASGLVKHARQAGFDTVPADDTEAEQLGLTLVFPTNDWDETTAGKVEAILAAKGHLIARALQIPATPMRINPEVETVEFCWFDVLPGPQVIEATSLLLARIIDHAKTSTRISSKSPTLGNDKYAMHSFLLRLGMIGDSYKHVRATLLRNLEGNTAWKTLPAAKDAR